MKSFEKVLLGSLVVGTTVSSGLVLAQAENLGETQYYLMNNLNMRKGPGTDYISIGTLKQGTVVTPLEYSQDKLWVKIKYNNQYVWVCAKYIKIVEENNNDEDIKLGSYKTKDRLNLRKGPSIDNVIILTMPKGSQVKVIDTSNDNKWAKVSYKNEIGWANATYIEEMTSQEEDNNSKYEDYITTSPVNVRTGPSSNYKKIGALSKGIIVKPIAFDKYGDWIKFNFNGNEGWVCKAYLKKVSDIDNSNSDKILYASANVNFRTSASVNSSKICTIPKNSKLSVLSYDSSKTWAQVKYNNKLGWVSANYLTSKITQDYKWGNTIARVNLRDLPSLDGNRLLTMPSGASIKIYEETNGWLKVSYNNTVGYCAAVYVK